jgi:hypothetical protein
MDITHAYFDARQLTPHPIGEPDCCAVSGCTGPRDQKVPSQWGEMFYCPLHGIRIHAASSGRVSDATWRCFWKL